MYKSIFIFICTLSIAAASDRPLKTNKPDEAIQNPDGNCEVKYGYYSPDGQDESGTMVFLICNSMGTVVLRTEGSGHDLTLEWLSNSKLKVTHPTNLIITQQSATGDVYHEATADKEAYIGEIEIEFDPPYEEPPEPEMLDETNLAD